jgi:dienelactone hydrolase
MNQYAIGLSRRVTPTAVAPDTNIRTNRNATQATRRARSHFTTQFIAVHNVCFPPIADTRSARLDHSMRPKLQAIEYSADGLALTGYLAEPEGTRCAPGVVVAHESIGINEHVRGRTQSLARLGYVAFALDLYGAADLSLDAAKEKSAELMRTPGILQTRAHAGLEVLAAHARVDPDRLAAIGYCQGGATVLELARTDARLLAVVGFHPGFHRPAGSVDGDITAKVLMMSGDADPVVSEDDRRVFVEEMRDANADWQLHVFGGVGHSYTNPKIDKYGFPGFAYDAVADQRSWLLMKSLLSEVFA